MPKIVLIHGIAAENSSAASLLKDWRPALAGGLANAGRADLSQEVLNETISVDMAFYGNLFRPAAIQDPAAVSGYAESLAKTIVQRAADPPAEDPEREPNPDTAAAAEELKKAEAVPAPSPTGADQTARPPAADATDDDAAEDGGARREGLEGTFLQALDRLPWIKRAFFGVAEDTVAPALKQVAIYMHDQAIRERVQQIVADLVDDETRAIVAHSLGSVVAFNYATAALDRDLPLLLTLGSPLGDKTLVYSRLVPQPPVYPPRVQEWVNIAARNDPVAANPNLVPDFGNVPAGRKLDSSWTVENLEGGTHSVLDYLNQQEVGATIARVLA